MAQRTIFSGVSLSKRLLSLVAIILMFLLLLVYTWLWYDIKIKALDKKLQTPPSGQAVKPP